MVDKNMKRRMKYGYSVRPPHWYGDEAHQDVEAPQYPATETGPELAGFRGGERVVGQLHPDSDSAASDLVFAARYIHNKYGGTLEQKAQARVEQAVRVKRGEDMRQASIPAARQWWVVFQDHADECAMAGAVMDLHSPDEAFGLSCACCGDEMPDPWPCPTIRAMADALNLPVPDGIEYVRREDLE